MISPDALQELFVFHYWARDRQFEACGGLSDEQFNRSIGGSYSSLRETLFHLYLAEWVWLEFWRGNRITDVPDVKYYPTVESIRAAMSEVETGAKGLLGNLTKEELSAEFSHPDIEGDFECCPFWKSFYHFLNHQSYHRGQVTDKLRQLGVKPPAIDFANNFLPSQK